MTGKAYYITTVADWQRHSARFANSHFIVLDAHASSAVIPSEPAVFADDEGSARTLRAPHEEVRILVLIEADEGVHLSLDDDPAFEPLPHPLTQKPISATAQSALAPHGVAPGATTFDAAEALARVHPLLRHRVF